MGFDPITGGAALLIGGIQAAAGFSQARRQNQAIAASQAAQVQAAQAQQAQLGDAAAVERKRNADRAAQVLGRLRVAAGEAGTSLGGSNAALRRQAFSDAAFNDQIILQNLSNEDARVRSGAAANLANLQSNTANPLLAGFTGALGGFTTGLQIGQGIQEIRRRQQTPIPEPYTPVPSPNL